MSDRLLDEGGLESTGSVERSLAGSVLWLARWLVADEQSDESPLSALWIAELWAISAAGRDVAFGRPDTADAWRALCHLAMAGLSLTAPDDELIDDALVGPRGWAMRAVDGIKVLRDAREV